MTDERDAYDVLQVRPDATDEVLRAVYRALARRYHPDGLAPDQRRMVELNQAWERIGTPERRAEYDRQRCAEEAQDTRVAAPAVRWDPRSAPAPGDRVRGSDVIDFGQYEGWRIQDVARRDPEYLRWLSRHSSGVRYLREIAQHLPGESLGRRTAFGY